jgi:outer membrane protein insertion porin family
MPVVNAPFRLYWAYNLSYVNTNLQPPILVNARDLGSPTYGGFLQGPYGASVPFDERRSLFRFSIGRVF